jgi:hypothetical protein
LALRNVISGGHSLLLVLFFGVSFEGLFATSSKRHVNDSISLSLPIVEFRVVISHRLMRMPMGESSFCVAADLCRFLSSPSDVVDE